MPLGIGRSNGQYSIATTGLTISGFRGSPDIRPERQKELEGGIDAADFERARRTYEADWIFGHERIHQRALTLASSLAHFDAEFPERYLHTVLALDRERVLEVGREILRFDSGVLGWSLPEEGAA